MLFVFLAIVSFKLSGKQNGWQNEDDNNTIQAFCHWSYHYSKGKYLFCDAQGIKKCNKYILTDPCILSNEENGRIYGETDVGRMYLLNWFLNHKCNRYCLKFWDKPTQNELNSVPQSIRAQTSNKTTYSFQLDESMTVKTIIRSKRSNNDNKNSIRTSINNGSIVSSLASITETQDTCNDDNVSNGWIKYKRHFWKGKRNEDEKPVRWSKLIRIKKSKSKGRNRRNKTQKIDTILFLTTRDRLLMIEEKNESNKVDLMRNQVKNVRLLNRDQFVIVVSTGTNYKFDCKGDIMRDDVVDARTWVETIKQEFDIGE